jgi:hypothetical protein
MMKVTRTRSKDRQLTGPIKILFSRRVDYFDERVGNKNTETDLKIAPFPNIRNKPFDPSATVRVGR